MKAVVSGRMHFKADDIIPHRGEYGTEERLDQNGVILQNFLNLLHLGPAFFNIQGRFRFGQGGIKLRVGITGLIPGHTGAVGQAQYHDGQGPVGPGGQAQGRFGPNIPILCLRHHIHFDVDPGLGGILFQHGHGILLPDTFGIAHVAG